MKARSCGFTVLTIAVLASSGGIARADMAHGFVQLAGISFDFSEQIAYPPPPVDYPGDISSVTVVDPPLGPRLVAWWDGGIIAIPDTVVESVTTAPTDAAAYGIDAEPIQGMAYVFRTGDGFYVKFAVREQSSYSTIIEYFVQLDGTNDLDDDIVAVKPTTWGRVKALYSRN